MRQYKSSCPQLRIVKEKSLFELESVQIRNSDDIQKFVRQFYQSDMDIYESMFLLLLNRANKTIGWAKISQGGLAGTICDPKIIAKISVEHMACGVVLVHNHPSGSPRPSSADETCTTKIEQGLALLDIKLLDHIILTSDEYYSFADEGQI